MKTECIIEKKSFQRKAKGKQLEFKSPSLNPSPQGGGRLFPLPWGRGLGRGTIFYS
jgi:hypothetical protein